MIQEAVKGEHPGVHFTDIWIDPRVSWCGSDMIDVWAIYDGEVEDLAPPPSAGPSLLSRMQDMIWDSGVEAFPGLHLVAKSDLEEHPV